MSPTDPPPESTDEQTVPTPPREVSEGELEEGLELEIETVHKLEIDPGFMFSG